MKVTHAHIRDELDRINDQETELQLRRITLWALDQRLHERGEKPDGTMRLGGN